MDRTESLSSQIVPLIRRRFLALWLAAVWPYALLAIVMICIAVTLHARAAAGPMVRPQDLWQSLSGLTRFGLVLAFILGIFLPRHLGAAGVAIIVYSDMRGDDLKLRSFLLRFGRVLWQLVLLSIGLGIVIYLGTVLILPGIFLAVWSAFVMPALATAVDHAGMAVRRSFRFSLRRFGLLLGLYFMIVIAQVPALLALFIPIFLTADGLWWWAGQVLGWILFAVLMGFIFMTQAVILAVLYLDALRSWEESQVRQLS
jgi:hypothetical protein